MEYNINILASPEKANQHNKNAQANSKKTRGAYVKNLESKNEELTIQLIEKINSATMQLNIVMSMLASGNLNRQNKTKSQQVDQVQYNEPQNGADQLESNNIWSQQYKSKKHSEQQNEQPSSKISTQQNSFSPQTTGSSFHSSPSPAQTQVLKLQQLSSTITNIQSKLGFELIQQQIRLQQEYEQTQLLAMYQSRILDMDELLVVKENDMVTEHTGGNFGEKMKAKQFRMFEDQCVEIGNIKAMSSKISYFRNQIGDIEKQIPSANHQTLCQIENLDKNKELSLFENPRVFQGKQNILQIILTRESHRIHSQEKQSNTFSDPFFRRIARIVKKQLAIQASLQKQYKETVKHLKEINYQHAKLAALYKKQKKNQNELMKQK